MVALAFHAAGQSSTGNVNLFCPTNNNGGQRFVSWKRLAPNLLCDQKRIWTFPWHLAQGQNALATAGVVGATTGIAFLDPSTAPYFRRTNTYNSFNRVLSGKNTTLAMILLPASFYVASLVRRNSYDQQSFLLAGEAVVDSEIVATVIKDVGRRLQPSQIPPNGNFGSTWFKSNGPLWRGAGSFPSGHEIAAMSIATVFARRYGRQHRWVPWVAYAAAGLIGFSRVSLSAHFASDVFAGAALGYSISRFAVLQP